MTYYLFAAWLRLKFVTCISKREEKNPTHKMFDEMSRNSSFVPLYSKCVVVERGYKIFKISKCVVVERVYKIFRISK